RVAPRYPSLGRLNDDDTAACICQAGDQTHLNLPIFGCSGQFSLYILALEKQGLRTLFQQWLRVPEELGQGSKSSRRNDLGRIGVLADKILDSHPLHKSWKLELPRGFAQERRLFGIAFDEIDVTFALCQYRGDHQAREATARPEIDPFARG